MSCLANSLEARQGDRRDWLARNDMHQTTSMFQAIRLSLGERQGAPSQSQLEGPTLAQG